jgi:AraC-like DNA-binding protein
MIIESIFLLLTSLVGISVLSVMLFSIKSNKLINLFLILIIIMTCSRFILFGTYHLGLQGYSKDFSGPIKSLLIYNIPFWYLYFKSLVKDNNIFSKTDLSHLILPFIFSIYIFTMFEMGYENDTYFRLFNFIFLVLLSLFYGMKSFQLLNNHLWNIPTKEQSVHQKLMRKWTIFIYALTLFLIVRLIVSFTFEFYSFQSLTGEKLILIQSIAWMITFLKIIISPEILYGVPKLHEKINSLYNKSIAIHPFWRIHQNSKHTQKDNKIKNKIDVKIINHIKEIEFFAVNQHFFRNQKITIGDLANEMNIPLSHLIYLFQYHCQLTFTEYKTHIKIEDAKQLIESGFLSINTLESLAIEVGFSSYNPFFTAFKKLVGISPNDYSINSIAKSKQSLAIATKI